MANSSIQIFINGQETDYTSITSIPIQFEKEIDDILNVVGVKGLSIDRIASQLVFPVTKRNESIFTQLNQSDSYQNPILGLVDVLIRIESQTAFDGKGIASSIIQSGYPKSFTVEVISDSIDIFPKLEEGTLCSLDLGIFNTNQTAIINSWSDPNSVAVLPPIVYGSTGPDTRWLNGYDGGREISKPYFFFRSQDLRPHIKIWWIVKVLFEKYLGYSIDSTIYESEFFRGWTYLFSNGEQTWKRTDDISDQILYVRGQNTTLTHYPPNPIGNAPDQTLYNIIMPTRVIDPLFPNQAQWINNSVFIAIKAGWRRFEFIVKSPQSDFKIRAVISEYDPTSATSIEKEIATFPVNEKFVTEPIYFEFFNGNMDLILQVELENVYDTFFYSLAELKVEMLDIGTIGFPIRLNTCLHCNKLSGFLLGILHKICGAMSLNFVNRTVSFENRFFNSKQVVGSGFPIPKPWYKFPEYNSINQWESIVQTDQEEIIERPFYPFGDSLVIGPKKGSDPLLQYYEEKLNSSDLELGQIRCNFRKTGQDGKTILNPFFEELANFQYDYPQAYNVQTTIGAIMNDLPSGDSDERYILPDRNFSSDPKIAFYHGIINFQAAGPLDFKWQFSNLLTSPYLLSMPCLFTRFPYVDRTTPGLGFEQYPTGFFRPNLCYNDVEYTNGINYGLARLFYLEYFALMLEGRKIEVKSLTNYDEFQSEDFRYYKKIMKQREQVQALIYMITDFEPLKSRKTKVVGLVLRQPTEEDLQAIDQNIFNFTFIRRVLNNI